MAVPHLVPRRSRLKPSYWVCILTRNGARTIGRTLDSILGQTLLPGLIVVVDDGSTDQTRSVIETRRGKNSIDLEVIPLPDRGYDIRRVPANLNLAYAYVERTKRSFEYSMITGDDCVFPPNYSEFLISRMEENNRLVIASGDWGIKTPPDWVKAPTGAGRFIRDDFWRGSGGKYPVAYGWEDCILFRALQLGYQIANFTEMRYQHLRSLGSQHRYVHWGIAMRTLGYHPLMVLLRIAKNILLNAAPVSIMGNLSMLRGYLFSQRGSRDAYIQYFDKDLRDFIRRQQIHRIRRFISRILGAKSFASKS